MAVRFCPAVAGVPDRLTVILDLKEAEVDQPPQVLERGVV
jgi:hypothetical protein